MILIEAFELHYKIAGEWGRKHYWALAGSSPWVSHISAHFANRNTNNLYSRLPFQRCCIAKSLGK